MDETRWSGRIGWSARRSSSSSCGQAVGRSSTFARRTDLPCKKSLFSTKWVSFALHQTSTVKGYVTDACMQETSSLLNVPPPMMHSRPMRTAALRYAESNR